LSIELCDMCRGNPPWW